MCKNNWLRGIILFAGAALLLAACAPAYPLMPMGGGRMNGNHMGGMMGNGNMGMMGQSPVNVPTLVPTPIGATPVPVDEEIALTTLGSQFQPALVTVTAGETVRWRISNQDPVLHNFLSEAASIPYVPLPANASQEVVWQAPAVAGTYTARCTLHPGMTD